MKIKLLYLWFSILSWSYKELVEDNKENETILFVVQFDEQES